jgi:hypothetical protein
MECLEKYQLAGLDPRERGFNRTVEIEARAAGFCAHLRYEALRLATAPCPSSSEAIEELARCLHGEGFRQLRSQLSFQNGMYLGSQQSWRDYPDPAPQAAGLLARLRQMFAS